MALQTLGHHIKRQAQTMGFTLAAIIPAVPSRHIGYYKEWLNAGFNAEMAYLARPDAIARRADLAQTVPGAQSVVVVAANYHTKHLPPHILTDPSRGIMAGYAWGIDYHTLFTPKLRDLQNWIAAQLPGSVQGRAYIDTGPVLERELAQQADLGFIGKNTCLINPRRGSFLFLGEIILDAALPFDEPTGSAGTCGRCARCLVACPTDALSAPYVLDSNRCISYLTIENKGEIPTDLRPLMGNRIFGCDKCHSQKSDCPLMGNRIFGCDICQEVCPYNRRFAISTVEPAFRAALDDMAPPLLDLISLDDDGFRKRFKNSPVKRAKRRGLLRNVAVALGNWGHPKAIPALGRASHDPEPLIREHARWALAQIRIRTKS